MLKKVVLTFKSGDQTLVCDHCNQSCWVALSCGTVYYAVKGGCNCKSVDDTLVCDHSTKGYWTVFSCGTVWTQEGMTGLIEVTSFLLFSIFEQRLAIVSCSVWWALLVFFIVIRQRYWPGHTNSNFTWKVKRIFKVNKKTNERNVCITTITLQLKRLTKTLQYTLKSSNFFSLTSKRTRG